MTKFFDKEYQRIIKEMSARVSDNAWNTQEYLDWWEQVKNKAELVEEAMIGGVLFKVYHNINGKLHEFFLFNLDDLAYYISIVLLDDGGVQVDTSIKLMFKGSLMMDLIYINFLLKHFKYVLSDNYHTMRGFGIYQRLADRSEIKVSVIKDGEIVEEDIDSKRLMEYYGGPEMMDYIYKVELK